MKKYIYIFLIFLVITSIILIFGLKVTCGIPEEDIITGKNAPNITLQSLENNIETPIYSVLRDELNIVVMWSTYCDICKPLIKELKILKKEFSFNAVGVLYKDDTKKAIRFLNNNGSPFDINLIDVKREFEKNYKIYSIAEIVIINKEKKVIHKVAGPEVKSKLRKVLLELNAK